MKVYLAGEREAYNMNTGETAQWFRSVKRRLFSYYYHGFKNHNQPSEHIVHAREVGLDLFLDSGAFTAFTQQADISVERYAAFIHETAACWSVCSCLDAIGDAQGSYDNLKALEALGCTVAPVFHCREDVSWLVKYLDEGYPYILLGGMVPETTRYLLEWLDWLWDQYLTNPDGTPRVKVHGFGLTDQQLMFRYPWYSVDSSSWLMTGIFGSCVFNRPQGLRKVVFSDSSPEARKWGGWHYERLTPLQQAEVDRWLLPYGVTAAQCAESYVHRDAVNAATFTEMESRGATHFKLQQEGLFHA